MAISPDDYQRMIEYKAEVEKLMNCFDGRLVGDAFEVAKDLARNNEFEEAFRSLMWIIMDSKCRVSNEEYERVKLLSDGLIDNASILNDFESYVTNQAT